MYLPYNALLPVLRVHCFGNVLTPDHYWREIARPVSCYALFKWWLLLSQHPGCHSALTSFLTRQNFGALAGDLGCFPLDPEAYPSGTVSRVSRCGIRSLAPQDSRVGLQANSVSLPPQRSDSRLALELFRRERAISQFDYTLSPPVSSSQTFATVTRSCLQGELPALHTVHR